MKTFKEINSNKQNLNTQYHEALKKLKDSKLTDDERKFYETKRNTLRTQVKEEADEDTMISFRKKIDRLKLVTSRSGSKGNGGSGGDGGNGN